MFNLNGHFSKLKAKYCILIILGISLLLLLTFRLRQKFLDVNEDELIVGQKIDSLNGVYVYYNGSVSNVNGRNVSDDGYNIGLKYQCVEFVKRYYFEYLNHKMPDSYGHAKDFFDASLTDSTPNTKRNLVQYTNPSKTKPHVDDLLIFSGTPLNPYGHVAIVAQVADNEIEMIQQNPGSWGHSRERIALVQNTSMWQIKNKRVLGWLRKED